MPTYDFVTDCHAPTDGVTDATSAVNTWIRLATASPGSTLNIPPAGTLHGQAIDYHFPSAPGFLAGPMGNVTINGTGGGQIILDSWGGTWPSSYQPASASLLASLNTSAYIASVSAGSSSVTLLNTADASKFTVGRWILVNGMAIQGEGFPPNW